MLFICVENVDAGSQLPDFFPCQSIIMLNCCEESGKKFIVIIIIFNLCWTFATLSLARRGHIRRKNRKIANSMFNFANVLHFYVLPLFDPLEYVHHQNCSHCFHIGIAFLAGAFAVLQYNVFIKYNDNHSFT